jgi:hypothetical protein
MKFGGAEGTPEEIKNFFANTGANVTDFLQKPEEPLAKHWLIIPALVFALNLALILILSPLAKPLLLSLFVLGAASSVWLAVCLQLKFKNGWATAVASIGCLLVLLVAAGFMAPTDTIDALKKFKGKE